MAIALDVSVTAAALNTFTTASRNTAAAPSNFLVLGQSSYGNGVGAIGAVSDNQSNAYANRTQYGSGSWNARISYKYAPTTNASHTFTTTGSTIAEVLAVLGFTGVQTSSDPFDVENGSQGTATTTRQAGSITPSTDGQVIIAVLCWELAAGSVVAINSGFTIAHQTAYNSGVNNGGAIAYLIQTTAAAVNPQWSWTTALNSAAAIASFKAAAGGGGIAIPVLTRQYRQRLA